MTIDLTPYRATITQHVASALAEDIGSGDITTKLVDANSEASASIITRESARLCGVAWVNEVYRQLDTGVQLHWHANDGDAIEPNQIICELSGLAQPILTGERTALNFLQTLSATATITHTFVQALEGQQAQLLDTRKTLPGLRIAQKYAVACGGAENHRLGLFDAYLIKENHVLLCGGIKNAIALAKQARPDCLLEIEVEDLSQCEQAFQEDVDVIMLDNFELHEMAQAVKMRQQICGERGPKLEVSGAVTLDNITQLAATGIDAISVGAITKNIIAIDFSLQVML